MNAATLALLRRVVVNELRRYRHDPDYEDIVQEGWLKAWREYPKRAGQLSPVTVAKVAARCARGNWIRSRKARQQWRENRSVPQWFFLVELPEEPVEEFETAVIDHLDAVRLANAALAAMTERQAHYVREAIMNEGGFAAVAHAEGLAVPSVWNAVQRGLQRAREALDAGR